VKVASLYRGNGADGYPAEGSIEVGLLQQLCSAAGVPVSDDDLRDVGCARINPELAAWLSSVVDDDDMVDTFAHCHPLARDRFTCWDQSTNRRYFNEGSRIDYILIDRSLLPYLQKGGRLAGACDVPAHVSAILSSRKHHRFPQSQYSVYVTQLQVEEEGSARAALRAALGVGTAVTGLGPPCYEPAPFGGGGLVDAPAAVIETMFCNPHTGIVYTPPRFSDHVAVSCLLLDDALSNIPIPTSSTADTSGLRLAQPHKHSAPITAFFRASTHLQSRLVAGECSTAAKRAAGSDAPGNCAGSSDTEVGKAKVTGEKKRALERLFHFGAK
jgi:hypothetical protein